MTPPTWKLSKDPGYLRIRGLIRKFFSSVSGRPYIDGRLSEDQKDDVQDAFVAYFEKIVGQTRKRNREEVVLYLATRSIADTRKKKSKITIGGTSVPRKSITIR